jgi:hypothetical protein
MSVFHPKNHTKFDAYIIKKHCSICGEWVEFPIRETGDTSREAKIRREGFPLNKSDAQALLDFIDIVNDSHDMIEPEIVVKLEILSGKLHLEETK